jgi:sigma-B regulation protein RsbU (phosphoserine phosphatase)
MAMEEAHIQDLETLNKISEALNRAVNIPAALNTALADLVTLMGLETGWIFLIDPNAQSRRWGKGYVLAAHHNLPPDISPANEAMWNRGCDCQDMCSQGRLVQAYNEIHCSRLAEAGGDRRGLAVHASTPLRSGDRKLGILNVAAQDWSAFTPRALALLTNVGLQLGIALDRANLFEMVQERRIQEQAALLELSNQLLSRRDLDDLARYLVNEVRRMLEADACALVLLEDDGRSLSFRAASGWNQDPIAARRRIPSDRRSGPGRVLHTQQPLLVEDLHDHDPTRWAPAWLREEDFRGHFVVPLVVEGNSIGTLIINDRNPREMSEADLRFLRLMANQMAIALENARLYAEERKSRRMQEEMAVGQQIQLSLLPKGCPTLPGWECTDLYRPARQVSGDFYDFFDLEGRLGLVVADVADKGVPAALYMAMCRTMIRNTAFSGRSPAEALKRANDLILKDSQAQLFLSAFYARLDPDSGHLVYANAGHVHPLCLRAASGEILPLAGEGSVMGMFESITLDEKEVDIRPGDTLVLYTDGVTEAMDPEGQPFGEARLRQVLAGQRGASAQATLDAIVQAISRFTASSPQSDDLTLLVLRRL